MYQRYTKTRFCFKNSQIFGFRELLNTNFSNNFSYGGRRNWDLGTFQQLHYYEPTLYESSMKIQALDNHKGTQECLNFYSKISKHPNFPTLS